MIFFVFNNLFFNAKLTVVEIVLRGIKLGNPSEIIRICFSTNALITGVVTIGLITIITYLAFTLEKKVSLASPFLEKAIVDILEIIVLLIAALLVEQVFKGLTSGSKLELGGLYANAELTLLFYGLFVFKDRLIVLMNIALPFLYNPSADIMRLKQSYWPLFIFTYIIFVIVIDYLYNHKDTLIVSNYKYLLAQLLFGICWWTFIWIDHRFPLTNIIGMLIIFEVYMLVVRIIEQEMNSYMHAFDTLQIKANYDALTGVRNRANLNKLSKESFAKYTDNSKESLAIIMFDIDHFKRFNDHYGHETGDEVLRHVAHIAERELHVDGSKGKIFRYGGEEFMILIKGIDDKRCENIINNINETLIEMPLYFHESQLDVTLCFGVTSLHSTDKSFAEAFKRVDDYLYESKNNGRNKMTIEGKTQEYKRKHVVNA